LLKDHNLTTLYHAADGDGKTSAAAAERRSITVGGGVTKMAATAARRRRRRGLMQTEGKTKSPNKIFEEKRLGLTSNNQVQ